MSIKLSVTAIFHSGYGFMINTCSQGQTIWSKPKGWFILVVVDALLFYVHGKHLRSCRDGQLT